MNRDEFLRALQSQLASLPPEEQARYLNDYHEIICDRMEEGMSEYEAVQTLGDPAQIAQQILDETPLRDLVKARLKPERKLRGWEIALLILGFPLWFPLLIAAGAIVFSLYISAWAIIGSLTAACAALLLSSPALIVSGVVQLAYGYAGFGLVTLGAGLFLGGVALPLTYGAIKLCVWFARGTVKVLRRIFTRKGKKS